MPKIDDIKKFETQPNSRADSRSLRNSLPRINIDLRNNEDSFHLPPAADKGWVNK